MQVAFQIASKPRSFSTLNRRGRHVHPRTLDNAGLSVLSSRLTAHRNADLLIKQALEFEPNTVVIGDTTRLGEVKDALWDHGIKVYGGAEALEQVVEMEGISVVLTALVGAAGLRPTLRAIRAKKTIALANKETLVVAGA